MFTSRLRVAVGQRTTGAASVPVVLLIILVALVAGAGVYVMMTGARDTAEAGAKVATSAPAEANATAVAANVQNLRLAVQTAILDTGGSLPKVVLTGGQFVVTDANGDGQNVAAGAGVTAGGVGGASAEDFCVWVATADGLTMHSSPSGTPQEGGC